MSHSLAPSVRAASITSSEIPFSAADHRESGRGPDVREDQRVVDRVGSADPRDRVTAERRDERVQRADVRVRRVDELPDDRDSGGRDRHRDEDDRLDERLVADSRGEHGNEEPEGEREHGVQEDPLQVVDQCAARWERVEVEEVLVPGEQPLVVVEADPLDDVELRVRVAEAVDDRPDERIGDERAE
jgi:hypothetical protein